MAIFPISKNWVFFNFIENHSAQVSALNKTVIDQIVHLKGRKKPVFIEKTWVEP